MKVSTFPYSALQMRRHRILSVIIGTLKKFDCITTSKGCTFLNIVKMSYLTIFPLIILEIFKDFLRCLVVHWRGSSDIQI